jgi:hypothetical protein
MAKRQRRLSQAQSVDEPDAPRLWILVVGSAHRHGGRAYLRHFKERPVPATVAQNSTSDARHPCTRQCCKDLEKTIVCKFGIARAALGACHGFQRPCATWFPRLGQTCAPRLRRRTADVADSGARSGRIRSSSHWSKSMRHCTPAAQSGRAAMVAQGAGPRRLCMWIVRYAACTGITMCTSAWEVNARETRSWWVVTYDAIKLRSTAGSSKSREDKSSCIAYITVK